MEVCGGVYFANWEQPYRDPQRELPYVETRNTTYRSLRSVQLFTRSSPFYLTPKIACLQWARHYPKIPLPMGTSAQPSTVWFPGLTRLSIPNGFSIGSAAVVQLTAECPYTLRWAALSLIIAPLHEEIWTPVQEMILWAYTSPQPKQHLDWISRFCTAHRRVFLYTLQWAAASPPNCPFPWGIPTPI